MKIQFLLVFAALFICCIDGVSTATFLTNEFNWRGKIAAGELMEIAVISGDIRIEIIEGSEAEIAVLNQGKQANFDRVRIQVKESAGGIRVCSAYTLLEEQGNYECPAFEGANPVQFYGNRQLRLGYKNGKTQTFNLAEVRTQFKVRVPRVARLAVRTHMGNIEAEWLAKGMPAQSVDLSSHLGNIRLTLSQTINAQVQLDTAYGEIATDFPVTIPGGSRGKGLGGTLGQGGPKIALITHNGNVEIRQAR
jgi:DUF4097 and DUF4098 domain-containing protein YvlB